jgi:tetratricopeptide (TPR) repeat protein
MCAPATSAGGGPNNVLALNNHGAALKELNRFEEALETYDRALAMQPS